MLSYKEGIQAMTLKHDLLQVSPRDFVGYLNSEGITRFYFVYDPENKTILGSHPQLQPIADFIQNDPRDFMQHEGLFFQVTPEFDTLQGAFVHRTIRGQAAGGVRYWDYASVEEYLRDGMRLAKGMTRKNALAGLWWGGGKGVMARNPDIDTSNQDIRTYLYREYGRFISTLRGCYITAEDVGTSVKDMADVFSGTRFTTCIPPLVGGSGNPSVPTARGVVCGMEAALDFLDLGDLSGKTIAIQGMGNVGGPLIGFLFAKKVKKIIACDIDPKIVEHVKAGFPDRELEAAVVARDDTAIFATDCDILSPNATGAILNPMTIPLIKAKIVCGAANNQLEDPIRDDLTLFERDIRYVPDFLTNRMGIVNAANEQYGYVKDDPLFERHLQKGWEHSVYQTTLQVLRKSCSTGTPTAEIAMRLADRLSLEEHPVFGHRGRQIIASLVADHWHETSSIS
jgi:glutamate dehydrogenase/leucine dehydrogenase